MKKNTIKIIAMLFGMALATSSTQADLVLGFDFQTGTAIGNQGSVLQTYDANFGTGTLYMDGTHGSSSWDPQSSAVYNQLNSFGGTAVNTAGTPFATNANNGTNIVGAITFRQPQVSNGGVSANGFSAVFNFSMSGYEDLAISYAFNRQLTTSFTGLQWDYSTDGTTWYSIGSQIPSGTAKEWYSFSLAPFEGLDNVPDAYVRITFSGATGDSKGFYMDNFQFNAAAIPEPAYGSLLLLGVGVLLSALRMRR